MKRVVVISALLAFALTATLLYAAGDLIVDGKLGIGTTDPQYGLEVTTGIRGNTASNFDVGSLGPSSTIYTRVAKYNLHNNFYGSNMDVVDDTANGASLGYVSSFTAGWASYSLIGRKTGFSAGTYDVYVRIRTDGSGNHPTGVTFGVYDNTAVNYPIGPFWLLNLTTSYQEVYAGRLVITNEMLGHLVQSFFSNSGFSTHYYVDYIKFVPAPFFGGSVGIGTINPRSSLDLSQRTDAVALPSGTTAQRPTSPVEGMIRYNSTTHVLEVYQGQAGWVQIGTPAGAVEFFAMETCPNGWIAANGASLSRAAYPALFAAIGTAWGTPNDETSFKLPDLRGEFVRGWDNGRGADPDRQFATHQPASKILVDWYKTGGGWEYGTGDFRSQYSDVDSISVESTVAGVTINSDLQGQNVTYVTARIRPRNVACQACIKY